MSFGRPRGLLVERRSWLADPARPATSRQEAWSSVFVGRDFARGDVPALCQGLPVPVAGTFAAPVVCDVSAIVEPDIGTIDGLARLALALRRLGLDVRLDQASAELTGLVALAGLADVVPCGAGLPVEVRRESEEREELRRVQEEDDSADPAG
jgi:hypothetical protein